MNNIHIVTRLIPATNTKSTIGKATNEISSIGLLNILSRMEPQIIKSITPTQLNMIFWSDSSSSLKTAQFP